MSPPLVEQLALEFVARVLGRGLVVGSAARTVVGVDRVHVVLAQWHQHEHFAEFELIVVAWRLRRDRTFDVGRALGKLGAAAAC